NITMRHVQNSPIFLRLGARLRGPDGTKVGSIKRVSVNNLVASDAHWNLGNVISGIPGHPIEDVHFSNVRIVFQGGGTSELAERVPPEEEKSYPEPSMFGDMPSYGFFFRHVKGITLHHVKLDFASPEARPAFVLDDVQNAWFDHLAVKRGSADAPMFDLRNVADFSVTDSRHISDTRRESAVTREKF
ncbi:MAG TPA: glycoside hydrolase family 28 protein, partial [Opitutus sp.]|nr:glycoside hydrolase family 28 protein [Opitutus sp.]